MSDNSYKYFGCLVMGVVIALFTTPLYCWALGELTGLLTIALALIFAQIFYWFTAFGIREDRNRDRRIRGWQSNRPSKGKIIIDRFGRIIDPRDRDYE